MFAAFDAFEQEGWFLAGQFEKQRHWRVQVGGQLGVDRHHVALRSQRTHFVESGFDRQFCHVVGKQRLGALS